MSEVINIKNRPVFLRWTFANVWIRGEELELARRNRAADGDPLEKRPRLVRRLV